MDYSMFYVLIICIVAVGGAFLAKFLREKKILQQQDLLSAITALNIGAEVVEQLDLKKEPKIKLITNVINLTMNYMSSAMTIISVDNAYAYAAKLCAQLGIELTTTRSNILKELLTIAINNLPTISKTGKTDSAVKDSATTLKKESTEVEKTAATETSTSTATSTSTTTSESDQIDPDMEMEPGVEETK